MIKSKTSYIELLLHLRALIQGLSLRAYFLFSVVLVLTLVIALVDVIVPTMFKTLIDQLEKHPDKNYISIILIYGIIIPPG